MPDSSNPTIPAPVRVSGAIVRLLRIGVGVASCGLVGIVAFGWLFPALSGRAWWPIELMNFVAFAIRTLSFHLALIAIGLIGASLMLRRWRVAIIALVPLAVFTGGQEGLWLARHITPGDEPEMSQRADLVVYAHNVWFGRAEAEAVVAEAHRHDADVIVLLESTRPISLTVGRLVGESHPHSFRIAGSGAFGQAVYSRFPFAEPPAGIALTSMERPVPRSGMRADDPQLRSVVRVRDREVVIQAVHLVSPGGPGLVAQQGRQVAALARFASNEARPLLCIGDFNSTPRSAAHARLRDAGLREAHAWIGVGRGTTWHDSPLLPDVLDVRIDHAFMNDALVPRWSAVGPAFGSDHRSVVVGVDLASPRLGEAVLAGEH